MKEFKVNMTRQFSELASRSVRTKNDIILILLEAISLLTNGIIIDRPNNDYILLRIDKMKRLFIVKEKKIFSFNFPFNVDVVPGGTNPVIYDPITNLELNGINLSILKSAFQEIFYENGNQKLLDLDSELQQILDSFEMKPNRDEIWQVLKKLLIFEPGYLRYDHDEERENGKLHPLNHLDINYSSNSTFKVGLKQQIDCDIFIDILNINTISYFISK